MNTKQRVAIVTTDNNVENVNKMREFINVRLGNGVAPIRDGLSQAFLVNVHSESDIDRLFNMSVALFKKGIIYTDSSGIALQIGIDSEETVLGRIKQVDSKEARFTDGTHFYEVQNG